MQNPQQMDKCVLPDTKLKFVHEIDDIKQEIIESEGREFCRKSVLARKVSQTSKDNTDQGLHLL